ncbi:hypothetical protein OM076_15405 [Solirubrobacter ginsenosidimutans]|uniref:Uncharacterized protein n=1 Tax=Solirubrobacter ginsenosidimutans TaxID=490573 RepID=A0A9X3MS89_9ACTN|nr:hypothetical protein [Solirubrobacter ginsenosidimutans]MDA0161664.1 hypothetical protein [Solirubrobacter ginsenosidimutans]
MRTLKKLVLGETWWLPLGIAVVLIIGGLVIRPLAPALWHDAGGFLLLAGVLAVLLSSVARSATRRE